MGSWFLNLFHKWKGSWQKWRLENHKKNCFNRPFLSSKKPHFQSVAKYTPLFALRIKNHFHIKGFLFSKNNIFLSSPYYYGLFSVLETGCWFLNLFHKWKGSWQKWRLIKITWKPWNEQKELLQYDHFWVPKNLTFKAWRNTLPYLA